MPNIKKLVAVMNMSLQVYRLSVECDYQPTYKLPCISLQMKSQSQLAKKGTYNYCIWCVMFTLYLGYREDIERFGRRSKARLAETVCGVCI